MHVTVTGFAEQKQLLKDMADPKKHSAALKEVCDETAKLMKRYAPRNTGKTEDTIFVIKVGVNQFNIVTMTEYAHFTEWGTKYINIGTVEKPKYVRSMSGKMSYRPWARPAMWQMMHKYPAILNRALFRRIG